MKRRTPLLLLAGLFLAAPLVSAQQAGRTPAAVGRSAAKLTASMVLTPDADWQAKVAAAPGRVPSLTEAGTVQRGRKLWLLIFFSNPAVDAAGLSHLLCDVRFLKPDGKTAYEQKAIACFEGRPVGPVGQVQLAMARIEFLGEPADPSGTWRVQAVLRDKLSGAAQPLFTAFTLR